jgi:formate dehydrogenase iron-sulfur subunit
MTACPFGVPTYEWTSRTPRVRKCDGCVEPKLPKADLLLGSMSDGATITGDREELIAEAQRRIRDKRRILPKIYGLKEVGGTDTFFLSAVPFEQLGLNTKLPRKPSPPLTWAVLSKVPT